MNESVPVGIELGEYLVGVQLPWTTSSSHVKGTTTFV